MMAPWELSQEQETAAGLLQPQPQPQPHPHTDSRNSSEVPAESSTDGARKELVLERKVVRKKGHWRQCVATLVLVLEQHRHAISLAAGPVVGISVMIVSGKHVQRPEAGRMMGVLVWMAFWWMTEALPVAYTAMLPLGLLPCLHILKANEVAAAYVNDTVVLFVGSFMMALAVERWGLHRRIALRLLLSLGPSNSQGGTCHINPHLLLLGFIAGPGFLSMWMSNTATAVLMVPMAIGILSKVQKGILPTSTCTAIELEMVGKDGDPTIQDNIEAGDARGDQVLLVKRVACEVDEVSEMVKDQVTGMPGNQQDETTAVQTFSKGLLLAVAYSCSIGGMATLTGTGPNLVLAGVWTKLFPDAPPISFISWLMFALPLSLLFLGLLWCLVCIFYCPQRVACRVQRLLDMGVIEEDYRLLGPLTFPELVILLDFGALVIMWIILSAEDGLSRTNPFFEFVEDGTVAILAGMVLFLIPSRKQPGQPILDWATCARLPWDIVLLLGGGFALSHGVAESGLAAWVGTSMAGFHSLPVVLLVPTVSLLVMLTTEFASNSATATIFLPLLAHVALSLGHHPLLLMLPATLACSFAFMLPIATPPNAIVYSTGLLQMREMMLPGLAMNTLGLCLLVPFLLILGSWVFGLEAPVESLPWLQGALNDTRQNLP